MELKYSYFLMFIIILSKTCWTNQSWSFWCSFEVGWYEFAVSHWAFSFYTSGFWSSYSNYWNGRVAWLPWSCWYSFNCCGNLYTCILDRVLFNLSQLLTQYQTVHSVLRVSLAIIKKIFDFNPVNAILWNALQWVI